MASRTFLYICFLFAFATSCFARDVPIVNSHMTLEERDYADPHPYPGFPPPKFLNEDPHTHPSPTPNLKV
ncbi:transmembrane protein, putative [Medicago truncatula]|uniref:Transmembrane protein, putative n=1 Tax=Medicago truncatula TaxID=3880 RepID=A0A072UXN1_MEDTR|nr:transmembrane protein, putative [Medicago truncatula]